MTHPATVPHSSPQKTPQSEREVAVSNPMKKAFLELERVKKKGDLKMNTLYATSQNELSRILARQWNPETGVTKALLASIDKWSRVTAATRNKIILENIAEARAIATKYLSAEMVIAWGVVDPSVKELAAKDLFATIQRGLNSGKGESMNGLSRTWWKNGFSQKPGRNRLIKSLSQNTLLFRDAVKAGTDLVKTGVIKLDKKGLPKYINRLIELSKDASRAGKKQFKQEFQKALKHVKGLRGQIMTTPKGQQVELLTRAGKKKILTAIKSFAKTGSERDLKAAVKRYSLDQALHNARTLQRSVTNMAFQEEVSDWTKENPEMVNWVAWMLAPVRNFNDICDIFAGQKHRADNVPPYPHYNCACTTQPILVPASEYFKLVAEREAA